MKRDIDTPNLRNAFRQEPERCHAALMQAARSVQEETKMKRASFRAVLIAVLILAAMTAVALAVGNAGLVDWFGNFYGSSIPQSAQEVLSATEQETFTAGPVSFTVKETLADGHVVYLTAEAKTADGSPAVLYMGNADPTDPIGETLAAALDADGITADTTFAGAAQTADLPLYSVLAWMKPIADVAIHEEMRDAAYGEDGSVLLIDMLSTDPGAAGNAFTVDIMFMARELDPVTLERKEDRCWKAEGTRTIPVNGVVAESTYAVSSVDKLLKCLTVTQVKAERTCAGVYVTVCVSIDEGLTLDDVMFAGSIRVLDADGNKFPTGLNLTAEYFNGDGSAFPNDFDSATLIVSALQYRIMIGADSLPDSMLLTDGTVKVFAEAE
jgi:hypothetical protein